MGLISFTLTGEQIRAARALARLDQQSLARSTGLSLETIKRLERIRGPVDANSRTLNAIAQAFLGLGIHFESGEGVGVRFAAGGEPRGAPPAVYSAGQGGPPGGTVGLMHRLIYFSTVDPGAAAHMKQTLDDLIEVSRRRNAELGVTGALLACSGHFLQVLEGEKGVVHQVYGAISADRRHRNLHIVENRPVASRQFSGWDLCCGLFTSDREVFRQEPAMANGFDPEGLTPATALGLLSMMRDLQQQSPRRERVMARTCPLAGRCLDTACAVAA